MQSKVNLGELYRLSNHSYLNEDFIIEHKHLLNWGTIIKRQYITPKIITECAEFIDWNLFVKYQKLTDAVQQKFGHLLNQSNVKIYANYRPNLEVIYEKLKKFGYNIDANYNVYTYLDAKSHNSFYDFSKKHSIENYLNKYNSNLISYKNQFDSNIILLTGINQVTDVKEDFIRKDKAYVYKSIPKNK